MNANKMNGRKIVRDILYRKEISQTELADKLNITRQLLNMRIKRTGGVYDLSATILAQTLAPLGYKLVAVPTTTMLPITAYEVDPNPTNTPKVDPTRSTTISADTPTSTSTSTTKEAADDE